MHTAARRPSDFRKCLKGAAEVGDGTALARIVGDLIDTVELLLLLLLLVEAEITAAEVGAPEEIEELLLLLVGARTTLAAVVGAKAAIEELQLLLHLLVEAGATAAEGI